VKCCSLQTLRFRYPLLYLISIDNTQALQYIFNTAGYHFPKPPDIRARALLTSGKGIIWAEGSFCCWTCEGAYHFTNFVGMQHSRHRKIMNPAFSYSALRGFLPLFQHTAQRVRSSFMAPIRGDTGIDRKQTERVPPRKWGVSCCCQHSCMARTHDTRCSWYW
jgi:hypothetical protein